ncbi:hypothetical protein GOBAR_AA24298 [Gossypium barbadense]|uniref:Metal transporter n=1 Tax=Gossypium barbadense TaxID=3634 RepID=A0A2P5WZ75_GOSBA|nr:hypothetical protein GOBAR_AA24298 [Gossypium barbadense]
MGSNSGQPQFIASTGNRSFSNAPLIQNADTNQIVVPDRKSWKNFFAYMGPGFLVSIAYIDPGNFETDLQAGAQYKYGLLWIILVASCAALVIQSLAANLGVVTGKHLAEHCRTEYPRGPNFVLWVLAEIAIVACDIPEECLRQLEFKTFCSCFAGIRSEFYYNGNICWPICNAVIGTAFALNMLFNIPVWIGVLLTGLSTLVLLALQQYGMNYAKPVASEVLDGLFVPQLKGNGATGLAISLLGAMVMPHNLFLHSALVLSRKIPRSVRGIKEACRFYMIESGFALMVAFLINISVISVSGAVCNSSNLNQEDQDSCEDLDLNKASFLLRGFLDLRLTPWIRNMLTRCLAIVPSLIVAIIGGSAGAGKLIIIASVSAITWIIGSLIMGINIYYLMTNFIHLLLHNHWELVAVVFLGIFGFSGVAIYLAAIAYLVFRPNKEATHLLALTSENQHMVDDAGNTSMYCLPREDISSRIRALLARKDRKKGTNRKTLPILMWLSPVCAIF